MAFPPLIRPHVDAQPTLDTAIWLLHLRWVAVAGQLVTMAAVTWGLGIALPSVQLLVFIGVTAVSNVAYWLWLSYLLRCGLRRSDRLPIQQIVSGLILIDIFVLTGMLHLTAGIANPFSLFYFVNIAVASAIVTPAWAWTVWATAVACVTLLLARSMPSTSINAIGFYVGVLESAPAWSIPKLGFLVSFATCSGVITYFIAVLTGELRQREGALQEAKNTTIRNRQLEGLATLATGAAHELASPLSTIAVVAKELSRALEKHGAPPATKQDVVLIRSELDQCRQILDRMTSTAGEAAGERLRSVTLKEFLSETLLGLRHPESVTISIADDTDSINSLLPVQAAAQAIRNLLQNALDACEPGVTVELKAEADESLWRIAVVDTGHGMPPEVLERIGEPFFTTKEPGRGMGLGLYLTQNVLRRLDGTLDFDSQCNHGTIARVTLPTSRG